MERMKWRDAARALGISEHEMYIGLVSGKFPGYRCGGSKGRWIVDIDLVQARIEALMLANVKDEPAEQGRSIRQIKG